MVAHQQLIKSCRIRKLKHFVQDHLGKPATIFIHNQLFGTLKFGLAQLKNLHLAICQQNQWPFLFSLDFLKVDCQLQAISIGSSLSRTLTSRQELDMDMVCYC